MADVSVRWEYKQLNRTLNRLPVNKATQQALRKAARGFVQQARRDAPSDTGALKKSVRQSRRIKNTAPNTYVVKAGPMARGRVHLYRGKEEARTGFVRGAYQASIPKTQEIFTTTYRRLLEG